MKRYSEVVLNGHPDKFCDLIADRIIREIYRFDILAYAQIEVSVWSDVLFLTGGVVTRNKLNISVKDIVQELGNAIGYTPDNYIDVSKYKILNHVCWLVDDPCKWTNFCNDQSIVVGYAGYDMFTNYLPPEHYLSWYIREALVTSIHSGLLHGQGPDGKILVVINEEYSGWQLDTLLVTLQQKEDMSFLHFTKLVADTLEEAYTDLQKRDPRWNVAWCDVKILINPNGPLLNGGSDGDNGQTGRKLVMDFYGPRIPIGGGALYGKDLTHIDRLGAFMARAFAVEMVQNGAKESLVKVCFAPGMDEPLSVDIISDKRPLMNPEKYFSFSNMRKLINISDMDYDTLRLASFYNQFLSFNKQETVMLPNLRQRVY